MTVFDNADWHTETDYPSDLPSTAAATHIGMYLTWCAHNGLLRDDLDLQPATARSQETSPGGFALAAADGVLSSDLFTAAGVAFTTAYYGLPDDDEDAEFSFDDDYVDEFFDDGESIYHVPDTWQSFDRISPVIDARFAQWQAGQREEQ